MPEGTGTGPTGDEVNRAIEALTRVELLRLKHYAVWRLCGLGRAGTRYTWEDLLGEAKLSILAGATNNGSGRRWNQNVDLVTCLVGAMRSISSHWKRDFNDQEAELESELVRRSTGGEWISPLDHVLSNDAALESNLIAGEIMDRLSSHFPVDSAAGRVVAGWKKELTASAIMQSNKLTKSEYQQAKKQIRHCLRGWGVGPKVTGRRELGGRR